MLFILAFMLFETLGMPRILSQVGLGAAMVAVAGAVNVSVVPFVVFVGLSNLIRNWLLASCPAKWQTSIE